MSIFDKLKNPFAALDFNKIAQGVPAFILKKIKERFAERKNAIDKQLQEGEKRPALILYMDAGGNLNGLWVTLDETGQVKRKIMVESIESLTQISTGDDILSLIPEIIASSGEQLPTLEQLPSPPLRDDSELIL